MYAFRKPINAAQFAGETILGSGVDLKTALLVGQILGYAASKYLGIFVCSSVTRQAGARTLAGLILWAQAALVAFAVAPPEWKVGAMFLNGLPLGMVWGLVVRYLEGRRTSELLLAALSTSFILASGAVKDLGTWLLQARGIPEAWMPAVAGALFLVPFLASVRLLHTSPPPDAEDEAARVPRRPMNAADRRAFLLRFGPAMAPLLVVYFFLTAYRDFRDNYGAEIFASLGYDGLSGLFTRSELPAAVAVLGALASLGLIRDHRRAILAIYGLMVAGLLAVGASTAMFTAGRLGGMSWMITVGVGSYLAYVPLSAVFFERLTAAGGSVGTAVFGIYIADALGYTGSTVVQIYRDLAHGAEPRIAFFETFSSGLAAWGVLLVLVSALLMRRALPRGGETGGMSGSG
jgi:hypothetical protein